MATIETEVPFDPMKHKIVRKGGVVGEKDLIGYLVYPSPPVGCMDFTTDETLLQTMEKEALGQRGHAARAGSAKATRKIQDKVNRRAMKIYLPQ